jgi:hypothetical protein
MGVALAMMRRSLAVPLAVGVVLTAPSVVSVAVAAGRPAARVSFEVTTTADVHDAHPGDGRCADSGDQCTLRAAVEEAAAQPLGIAASITLPAGTYPLILGSLDFDGGPVSVAGAGARSAVIEATGNSGCSTSVPPRRRTAARPSTTAAPAPPARPQTSGAYPARRGPPATSAPSRCR